jgi:hypothetical protein
VAEHVKELPDEDLRGRRCTAVEGLPEHVRDVFVRLVAAAVTVHAAFELRAWARQPV